MPSHLPQPEQSRRILPDGLGRAPLYLAALVLVVTLLITFGVFNSARHLARAGLRNDFDHRSRDMATVLVRRMAVYEQVLRGAQGFLRGSVDISRKEFADYFAVLKLDEHFPGIEALGIATIVAPSALAGHEAAVRREGFPDYAVHPRTPRPFHTSITHIEPFQGRNLRAFGYDMFSEPARRAAMEAARDSGKAAVTGKVVLVQEGAAGGQAGILMYLPVFRAGMPAGSVSARRAAILGWVYAPFRMNDLMRGLGGEHSADLVTSIYDGERADPGKLLYRTESGTGARKTMFSHTSTILMEGRPWTLVIESAPSFEAGVDATRPAVIAVTGTGLALLLSIVVWLLASERSRAVGLAREMTVELRASWAQAEAERTALQRAQKLEAVGKLTGGVAHDFNNLLHIISANVQLLQRSPGNQAQRLQSILDAVERGSKLSSQLLAFARRQPLHPQVVNVASLVERMDSLLQRAAGDGVGLKKVIAPDLWNALVDPNQLEHVILNLVINARDAMDGRGIIKIELANETYDSATLPDPDMAPGEYVMVLVCDTGSGMPPDVMERAFEPFFTTKPEGKGTGLGLSMAHGFAKQSGGHIRLSSKPGDGTSVSIYLPRCVQAPPDAADAQGRSAHQRRG